MTHKRNWSASVLHPTLSLHVHAHMKKEYWSGLPWPPLGELPEPGIKPASLLSPALAGRFFTTSTTGEAPACSVSSGIHGHLLCTGVL